MPDPSKSPPEGFGPRLSRCLECKVSFRPHARLRARQKTCARRICQLAYRARYRRQYRVENRQGEVDSQVKVKSNHPTGFWKKYRTKNPQSSDRNRAQTRLRKNLKHAGLQRQLDIVQVIDPPGYFELYQGFATSHRSLLEACRAKPAA